MTGNMNKGLNHLDQLNGGLDIQFFNHMSTAQDLCEPNEGHDATPLLN